MQAKIALFPLNNSPFSKELEITKKEAEKTHHKMRHGALIIDKKRKIYLTGSNSPCDALTPFWILYSKCHPNSMRHAEISALAKTPCKNIMKIFNLKPMDILRGATVFTYRLSKTGVTGVSRPCPKICWPALKALGFKDAVYIARCNNELMVAREYF